MKDFTPTSYTLECVATGREFEDTGWMLSDPQCKTPSLIRAKYARRQLEVKPAEYGLYRFCDWMPVRRILKGSSAPVTYKSKGLAAHLGLENLWITFNGYYPAIGATMSTCSFKETEAYSVCGRAAEHEDRVLVVASAGNTARAFAKVCSDNNIKLLLSVPYDNIGALWFEHPLDPCVKLISCAAGGDYFDAIHLSDLALKGPGFYAEGGAKNIARRDGMATTVLSAVTTIGRIPDYYFQAVGSGTGAIAAWEANMRLIGDGRFGTNTMKLMVSQNAPFVPMYDAWQAAFAQAAALRRRQGAPRRGDHRRQGALQPPPALRRHRRALRCAESHRRRGFRGSTNAMARKARKLFHELEGVDIYSAAGVAHWRRSSMPSTAGKVEKDATVMLNVTGGGEEHFKEGKELWYLKPSHVFPLEPDDGRTWSPKSRRSSTDPRYDPAPAGSDFGPSRPGCRPAATGRQLRTMAPFPVRCLARFTAPAACAGAFSGAGKENGRKGRNTAGNYYLCSGFRRAARSRASHRELRFFLLINPNFKFKMENIRTKQYSLLQALESQKLVGFCQPPPLCDYRGPLCRDVDPATCDARCVRADCRHDRCPQDIADTGSRRHRESDGSRAQRPVAHPAFRPESPGPGACPDSGSRPAPCSFGRCPRTRGQGNAGRHLHPGRLFRPDHGPSQRH